MHVAVDDIFDGLVGNEFLDLVDQDKGALFVERGFHKHDMIALLDGNAVVRPAGEVIDTVSQLFDRDRRLRSPSSGFRRRC